MSSEPGAPAMLADEMGAETAGAPTARFSGAPPDCEVAIVGGGLVGASLAVALSALPLRVVVIEAVPPEADAQPSFDSRTTALSNGSRRILQGLGVWDEIARAATPIRRIHVSDRGRFAFARLDAEQQGVAALGYVVENRAIGAALWRRLRAAGRAELVSPAKVVALEAVDDRAVLTLAPEGGPARRLATRLAVAADGAQSLVRRESGVEARRWDYGQIAIIANVVPERFHENVAYERFTPEGPLAVLPIADGRCGIVLALAPEAAAAALAQDDASFLAGLQERFGWRLGRFTKVGRRHAYPLALTRSEALEAPRVAIIGNAAQGLHPISGQGFNLGLRDAATLAEVIARDAARRARAAGTAGAHAHGHRAGDAALDPGDAGLLGEYVEWRRTDRGALIALTDGLVRLFGNPSVTVRAARALGLLAFDAMPPAKDALARLSLGFAGRLPRLARGLPLVDLPAR